MHKVVTALLGGAMVVTLAAPALADTTASPRHSVANVSQLERDDHDFRCRRDFRDGDFRRHRDHRDRFRRDRDCRWDWDR